MNADEIMRLADEYRLASDWRYEAIREALAAAVRELETDCAHWQGMAGGYRARAEKAEQEVKRLLAVQADLVGSLKAATLVRAKPPRGSR